ncbi:hypothetical protein [Arthrospira platensis]|jgi:hypothetical protein|uniref:Transposase n=1 Tax=Limnospira platensis NIES-46 TaxID=1236695 RepID=A0A5M3TDR5_LIMPL|nr:hypothetical protein [Arthrospira platensis]AMW27087.1 hypothetical protein AP285_02865 [Arthrospira platensis YZ]KDR58774.1 hypothetical protein APPUASWS_003075 [Arthrospira platensis str. Paraca]MBD2669970.1 hypothetical protein [Arthrospira platensis FACHB-439]MBD2710549.1 hypothetical protein [Arthrospira platensis FACHB-835]MDF2211449.1 hypothetical protein [Arthrospira platensis NCB002]MDT9181959.1 hypothetical protein [Limnospira sp. PMC 289.06]MDT9295237.1 hypothetical protein [Ar
MKIDNFYTKIAINNQREMPTFKQLIAVEAYKILFIAFILLKKSRDNGYIYSPWSVLINLWMNWSMAHHDDVILGSKI